MSNVTELHVIGQNGSTIFDTEVEYVIPLYQRAFAWEDKQLIQLIEDIDDVADDACYYMGSLIVARQGNTFEVIDGQQRLTSLFLLLNCLEMHVPYTLKFACRAKSNYTLENIQDLLQENYSSLDLDKVEEGIQCGIVILKEKLKKLENEQKTLETFKEKLKRVVMFRIEVPDKTDLNRYFEIMNTRGEQLEQHDILKARLMKHLGGADGRRFAKIWEACSDMTGYVQMHFDTTDRKNIFGNYWDWPCFRNWSECKREIAVYATEKKCKIVDIINKQGPINDAAINLPDEDPHVRFESVIDFPYFLLHTLKVLIDINGIRHEDDEKELYIPLDDKKLVESFDRVIEHGVDKNGKRFNENEAKFVETFIPCLLKARYLFDQYIIKREFADEDADGEWSLKTLVKSDKKPYYKNTKIVRKRKRNNDEIVRECIMLQSALRVSYTSPKAMHWITRLLTWLFEDDHWNVYTDDYSGNGIEYYNVIKDIAKEAVINDFLSIGRYDEKKYAMGVNTPHIVFNYLDYLIWHDDKKKYSDFKFEFRNSVEHWYPQHPAEDEVWEDGVDRFGNLCIVQRRVNSRFSNLPPEAKSKFTDMISKGSLKLRLMRELTEKKGNCKAGLYWKETACQLHEKEMLDLLKKACYDDEGQF